MIAGRPTNLWIGLITAFAGALGTTAIVLGADPAIVGSLSTSWLAVAGALVALVAVQPPTVTPGDTVKVQTAAGQPNYTIVAAATPPPVTVPTEPPAGG